MMNSASSKGQDILFPCVYNHIDMHKEIKDKE